jgi:two-component system, chemotaxis family, chemotaxis protein CheY
MNMRILIVDDSDTMRCFLRNLLRDMQHDTCESRSGSDAIARYEEYRPDLVLMDIRMPYMDGIEATEQIRRIDTRAQVAIVTEVDDLMYRDSAFSAGAVRYFLKDDLLPLVAYVEGCGVRNP